MKQQIITLPNAIALQNGDHHLGAEATKGQTFQSIKDERFKTLVPVFQSLYTELCDASAILKLTADANKKQIDAAYGTDVQMLSTRTSEFDSMVRRMIAVGIKIWQLERQPDVTMGSQKEKDITGFLWDMIQQDLPEEALQARAPLWMSADDHIMDLTKLIPVLKERADNGFMRIAKTWNSYFNTLIEKDILGLIEWKSSTVCKYHYFTHEGARKYLLTYEYEKREDATIKGFEQVVNEYTAYTVRVEHHLTEAAEYSIKKYPAGLPALAADFLNDTPSWLSHHLGIVAGQLTRESVFKKEKGYAIIVEEPKMVYAYDPAISFGEFILPLGWLKVDYGVYAKEQALAAVNRRRNVIQAAVITGIVGLVIFGLYILVMYLNNAHEQKEKQAYSGYMTTYSANPTYTVKIGEKFAFPKPYDRVQWILGEIRADASREFVLLPADSSGSFRSVKAQWAAN